MAVLVSRGDKRDQAYSYMAVVAVLISVTFSSRDGRHPGDARHDGFRPCGRGRFSSWCARRMRGHSGGFRERLSGSDNHPRSSSLHDSHW